MTLLNKDTYNCNHCKLWKIILILMVLSAVIYKALYYDNENRIAKWNDDTICWIIFQEIDYTENAYPKIKVSEIPDIKKLNLDAELIKSIKDLKYVKNLEELILNVKNVKNLKILHSLEKLDKLVIINGNTETLKNLKNLKISTLVLKNFTLDSAESLLDMDNLSRLEIDNSFIKDAEVLSKLDKLSHLTLSDVQTDNEISLCKNGNYESLYLSNVKINDFEFLKTCEKLTLLKVEKINMEFGKIIEFPTCIKNVTFKACGLKNLEMFLALPKLICLDVSDNEILDISDLSKLNYLKELSLANNSVHDLTPIENLKGEIKLNISGIKLEEDILSLLSTMQFEELYIANCDLSNLDFLEGHKEIRRLDISNNSIRDIDILKMYRKELTYLNIAWNPIEDLSPLVEWAPSILLHDKKNAEFPGVEFDMSGIKLDEIEEEKGIRIIEETIFRKLIARNCGLKDADLVQYQLKIEYLDISNNPVKGLSGADNLKFLKEITAKNTLINGDKISLLNVLSPSKTYAIPAHWKTGGLSFFFYGLGGKREWTRVILR